MTTSLEAMIEDHRFIEQRAMLFKSDLQIMGRADAGRAAYGLYELSKLITDHLEREGHLVAAAEEEYGQTLAWHHIHRKYNEIKLYWLYFIREWNLVSIVNRWAEFRLRARRMVSDIQNLVQIEIDRIYMPALRLGLLAT